MNQPVNILAMKLITVVNTLEAAALKKADYDIIFFGRQAIDDDGGAVGIHVAELLGLPHVAGINKFELKAEERKAVAHRQIDAQTGAPV